jgi:hypothetical protein
MLTTSKRFGFFANAEQSGDMILQSFEQRLPSGAVGGMSAPSHSSRSAGSFFPLIFESPQYSSLQVVGLQE